MYDKCFVASIVMLVGAFGGGMVDDAARAQESLTARGESLAAFDGRCIPGGCVAPPSNTPGILGRRALPAGRLARLGATPDFHRGLLAQRGQAAAPTKPMMVEDVFKNVQALKGIGVDDFLLTMGIMSAAVGSDCVGCHPSAGTDHVDWALDTPRKRTARRMVQMVTAINRDTFSGRQVVTCWTCHRGRDRPVTTMTMDVVYGPPTDDADDVLAQAQGVPSVDQVLDKYLQAIGGAENVA